VSRKGADAWLTHGTGVQTMSVDDEY
jgi:hypothetical protein